jgi:hypothetical protein
LEVLIQGECPGGLFKPLRLLEIKMIKLYSPRDAIELAPVESILEGENIPYFIHNDHFGSLEVGPQIDIFNKKTVMVNEEYEERARELLHDFFETTKENTTTMPSYSISDKMRMILEALFFNWFVPGRPWKKKRNKKEKT